MPAYIEKAEMIDLPVIALKGVVAFPSVSFNIELTDEKNIDAAEAASLGNSFVFLVLMKDPSAPISAKELSPVGTVAKIINSGRAEDGVFRILVEGYSRATVVNVNEGDFLSASVMCKTVTLDGNGGVRGEAYMREAIQIIERIAAVMPSIVSDIVNSAKAMDNPGMLADFIAANVLVRPEGKQRVLECFEPLKRIETLVFILAKEASLLEYEIGIHKKVRERLGEAQRERYLREQLAVIEDELGGGDEEQEYYQKMPMLLT